MINNLKKLRKELTLTQSDLAYLCSVNRETIVRIENDKVLSNSLLAERIRFVLGIGNGGIYKLEPKEIQEIEARLSVLCRKICMDPDNAEQLFSDLKYLYDTEQ